jgi:hypothetical protein
MALMGLPRAQFLEFISKGLRTDIVSKHRDVL